LMVSVSLINLLGLAVMYNFCGLLHNRIWRNWAHNDQII
jgi:hypothetical protein